MKIRGTIFNGLDKCLSEQYSHYDEVMILNNIQDFFNRWSDTSGNANTGDTKSDNSQ